MSSTISSLGLQMSTFIVMDGLLEPLVKVSVCSCVVLMIAEFYVAFCQVYIEVCVVVTVSWAILMVFSDEQDITEIATDLHMLDKLKARVQLARKIDNAQHKLQKENHDRKWLQEAADAMEVELDSDMDRYAHELCQSLVFDIDNLLCFSDSQIGPNKRERKDSRMKSAKLKAELKDMLAMPLIGRGISTRYITSGSSQIVDDILNNDREC
jgi:hypothetical protein